MGNSLQKNPSNAADEHVQPDWNSKAGTGVEPHADDAGDFAEIYAAQREGAKADLEAKNA